jgi:regulatory protein
VRRGIRRDDAAAAPMTPARARAIALTLLSRREYTAHEVHSRVVARGCSPDEAASVVAALVADGLIDDRRAAGAHVRTAARIKGRGRHRIDRELAARGVAKDIRRDVLGDLTPEAELDAIRRILLVKRAPARPDPATRRRLFQHLLRRGYSGDAIAKVLRDED